MRSARLIGARPTERKRLLSRSAAASRSHSRFGCPVRLSKGSTSRIRPRSAAGVEEGALGLSPGTWADAQTAQANATKKVRILPAKAGPEEVKRNEDVEYTTA